MRQSISYGALLFVLVTGLLMSQCKVLKQRQDGCFFRGQMAQGFGYARDDHLGHYSLR